uniref:Uncharacterized protein n=1 Tax=Astyanax mexicanus TaxID=7994 RepID=A0A8B9JVL6_ASTMX
YTTLHWFNYSAHSELLTDLCLILMQEKLSYDQDTVKESSDLKRTQQHGALPGADSDWKRRRCGVPDFPSKMGNSIHHQAQRFVLFGGRWEKTDLTYK